MITLKKLLCILCALALLILSGCSLAKADSVDPGAEILVGAFVSLEPIVPLGSQLPVEAVQIENGWEIPGAEGVWVYCIPVYENGGLSFKESGDPRVEMSGVTARVGGGIGWSAVLSLANTIDEDTALHFNLLYLRQDGSLYADPNNVGVGIDPEQVGQFVGWTSSHESVVPVYDWTDSNWTTQVEIRSRVIVPAETYVLCRMDDQNRELSREEYLPGQLPEEVDPECSWLLLEKHLTDGTVEREAFDAQKDSMVTVQPLENGLCARQTTRLVWER